jgi:hypothetical protein
MRKTVRGIVHDGKIALLEPVDVPEGTRALVTLLPDEDAETGKRLDFWLKASRLSLNAVWDNPEDDVYAELFEE